MTSDNFSSHSGKSIGTRRARPHVDSPKVGEALRGADKMARLPLNFAHEQHIARKPPWIRVKSGSARNINRLRDMLRNQSLHTVCEEASCPNLSECFSNGTATFMLLGDICTRRCPFCDVAHGRPLPPDPSEPQRLATTVSTLGLRYVVLTSVDRDDLRDGGAEHFAQCISALRSACPSLKIETLVPDFRGRLAVALEQLALASPDVFNHNLETVPSLYRQVRPGADYQHSLTLLKEFAQRFPEVPTKSGLMLGLGETQAEVISTLKDLRAHEVAMVTLGQYLRPSASHHPVVKYWHPSEFDELGVIAEELGFQHVASGPMVRSSYHAEEQHQASS